MVIVYVLADTLVRTCEEGVMETRIFQRAICGAEDPDEAYGLFVSQFAESKEAHEGWQMVGAPGKLDVDAEVHTLWGEYISAGQVLTFGKPRLVE